MDEAIDVDALIEALMEREGGYVDNPADRGGPTCFGITQAVARANGYCGSMRQLPREEAAAIYRRLYWLRPHFDEVAERSPRVAAELFDTGANMGPAVAVTFLQRALTALNRNGRDYADLVPDGRIGPRTLGALDSFLALRGKVGGETVLLRALEALQGERYLRLAERRPGNYILDKASTIADRAGMDDILAPRFIDPVAARKHLEALRWPDGEPVCPHCGSTDTTRLEGKKHRDGLLQCNDCREQFTVTVGTVFERSKVPLNKWLLCNHLLCAGKKGVSAHQIHRMLGVTYKTAWFMCHRLREAMKDDGSPLGGPGKVVESDEAFIGGKTKKRLSGKVAPMKKVMTLVERDGRARSFHVANLHANNIRGALVTNVHRDSYLMTDDARVYWSVGREFHMHGTTLHAAREFARPGGIHSNTAENFFSILKRGVIGTYHHWSPAHMHRYLAEFDFRYSTKDISDRERADKALIGSFGKRLTYRRTDALAA